MIFFVFQIWFPWVYKLVFTVLIYCCILIFVLWFIKILIYFLSSLKYILIFSVILSKLTSPYFWRRNFIYNLKIIIYDIYLLLKKLKRLFLIYRISFKLLLEGKFILTVWIFKLKCIIVCYVIFYWFFLLLQILWIK